MHGGFQPLRQHCTMNLWLPVKARPMPPEVIANVKRIETIWAECRARFGGKDGGPFLFGAFGNVDAMYAPVVARFHNYGLPVGPETRAYMDAVMALPAWRGMVRRRHEGDLGDAAQRAGLAAGARRAIFARLASRFTGRTKVPFAR